MELIYKYFLDTNIFLNVINNEEKFVKSTLQLLTDINNRIYDIIELLQQNFIKLKK